MSGLEILYEDNHLLVVNKPAGLATMGAESGPTVHSLAAEYIKRSCGKPGRAFVGIVSRLDAMTSGVLVLARTSKAASRLSAQFSAKSKQAALSNTTKRKKPVPTPPRKLYLAVVEGQLDGEADHWLDQIRKDDSAHRMRLTSVPRTDSQIAELRYQLVAATKTNTIVAVELLTGRKHQIRAQFSDRGHPVLGDRKYESGVKFSSGIALHSWRLQIEHPTQRIPMWFEAPLPSSWGRFQNELDSLQDLREHLAEQLRPPTNESS